MRQINLSPRWMLWGLAGCLLLAQPVRADTEKVPLSKLRELSEIVEIVKKNYVEEVTTEELLDNAIRGVLGGLDPHSVYLDEAALKSFESSIAGEEFGGVGMYLGQKGGWISVVAPIAGTPADRAGVLSGDLIVKIDGEGTKGMGIDAAVGKMRGVVGDVVVLEILTPGEPRSRMLELAREKIAVPSVLASLAEKNYGYIRITQFQNGTADDLVTNLNRLLEENGAPLKGIVLDLRNNPGGLLTASIGVSSVFLQPGQTVVSDKNRNKSSDFVARENFYRDLKQSAAIKKTPLVVLVNNGSASASEIVVGALKDHRRAVIVGERTYGKGSVQQIIHLPKTKSAVKLTMSRYYTPSGEFIQARGIQPDIPVSASTVVEAEEEKFTLRESDLPRHLQNDDAPETEIDDDGKTPFVPQNDYQYEQALIIVKSLAATAAESQSG